MELMYDKRVSFPKAAYGNQIKYILCCNYIFKMFSL